MNRSASAVGFCLRSPRPEEKARHSRLACFFGELRRLGYVEGQNLIIGRPMLDRHVSLEDGARPAGLPQAVQLAPRLMWNATMTVALPRASQPWDHQGTSWPRQSKKPPLASAVS